MKLKTSLLFIIACMAARGALAQTDSGSGLGSPVQSRLASQIMLERVQKGWSAGPGSHVIVVEPKATPAASPLRPADTITNSLSLLEAATAHSLTVIAKVPAGPLVSAPRQGYTNVWSRVWVNPPRVWAAPQPRIGAKESIGSLVIVPQVAPSRPFKIEQYLVPANR